MHSMLDGARPPARPLAYRALLCASSSLDCNSLPLWLPTLSRCCITRKGTFLSLLVAPMAAHSCFVALDTAQRIC